MSVGGLLARPGTVPLNKNFSVHFGIVAACGIESMWNAALPLPSTALPSHGAGGLAKAQELSLALVRESCFLFRLRQLPGKSGTGVPSTAAVGEAAVRAPSMDAVN